MTREEQKQVKDIWAEIEKIISVVDPNFNLRNYNLGQLNRESFVGLTDLITVLRIQIKSLKHDIESTCREKNILMKIIMEGSNG